MSFALVMIGLFGAPTGTLMDFYAGKLVVAWSKFSQLFHLELVLSERCKIWIKLTEL